MAQKPNFLKKFISSSLVGASTFAIIAGASSAALGAQQNRTTIGNATTVDGAGFDQNAVPANVAVGPNAVITFGNFPLNFNTPAGSFNGLFLNTADNVPVTVSQNTTLGFISNVANNANVFNFALGANQTLTITGQGITAGQAAATVNAQDAVAAFNGGGAIANNDLSGLGATTFANPSTLEFNLTGTIAAAPVELTNATIVGSVNATLNITKGFIKVVDQSFSTIKTINIANQQGLIINSKNADYANAVNLQVGGAAINFQGAESTLALVSNNDGATDFNVTGSLGGAGNGVISLDTKTVEGQLIANAGPANAVIGTNNAAGRAAGFVVTAADMNAATIDGQVYAKDLTLNGGAINFGHIVDVGADGTTTFVTNGSIANISQNSTLGAANFGNTNGSRIVVADTMTLTGNFTGIAANNHVITFAANGTLAGADANAPVTTNITAIEANAAGTVKLSGIHTAELRLGNAGSIFKLADGTVINGNVNQTALLGGALANGAITLDGDATITGDIGNNGAAAAKVRSITLANDADKTLTLGGANIIGAAAIPGAINFQANGSTVKLNSTANNILVNFNLALAADQRGSVDASSLTNAQTLTISGKIGTIAAGANKTLAQLKVGSSKTILNSGDVAINDLVIGNAGSVQIAHNTYLITKTTNAAGQGKMIIAPTANAGVTTLASGTNLGSKANPLAEVNFAAPGVLPDIILNVGQNTNLYAIQFTTVTPNNGSFSFTNGGTNVIGGTVGTQANQFKNVTVTNGSTATFTGNAIFGGESKIGANSTLQIGGNYTANSIVANAGGDAGTLQFVNNTPVTLTVSNQGAPVAALSTIKFSGSGDVTFNPVGAGANPGVTAPSFTFADNSLGARVYLAKGVALDNYTIISTVGNKGPNGFSVPVIVVNGADSAIGAAQAIGDADNIVGIALASDNTIDVQVPNLFAGIAPINDGEGTVRLNGGNANVPGTIYGLGAGNGKPKLELVEVNTNYQNFGNTVAEGIMILDGVTYKAGGAAGTDFDGTITLGSANGNSTVIFADGTNSTAASEVLAFKANNGVVTYLGNAVVGNIGGANKLVASVKFIGGAGKVEKLLGNIYAQAADFGASNLIAGASVTLGNTTTAINGNIDLQTNILTFATGTTTWGSATSLSTTLDETSGVLGKIIIADVAQVNTPSNMPLTVYVQDNASADFTVPQTYTLIQGGKNLKGTFANPNFVNGSNRFVNYTVSVNGDKDYILTSVNGDKDYILTRTNNAVNVFTNDIGKSNYSGAVSAADIAAFTSQDNTGLARVAYANALKAKNATDSANFLGALVSNASAAITTANIDTAKDVISTLGNRVNYVRYLGAPVGARENTLPASEGGAAVAAGDEAVDNVAYGAWVKPFYKDEHQKARGGVAGYKAKTTGGVIGLDTMANDNLMIGAAVGITKTDMKHQDYNKGNKTDINGVSFSLYGAQQLVNDFFAQGSAIFSLNQVKNKSKRYVFDNNGVPTKQVASGNYDNMTFGGNLMLGYDANVMEGMLITPMAGLNYLKSSDENYKETGATFVKQVNSKFSDRTDVIAGAKVMGNTMNISDFAVYPEAHAFITHKISGKLSRTQSYLDGQVQSYVANADKTAKTSYNVGLSAIVRPDAKMEYGIGYDFNAASKYTAHQGTLKVRVNF
ncbi:MAG: autotransporter outer membrane beta-barrel domain-containing protein [Rickettsia endosymbiont of Pentastiridius leporinus]